MSAGGKLMLQGEAQDGAMMFAAVDPAARYCSAMVSPMRFGAVLTPFPSVDDAKAALQRLGSIVIVEVETKKGAPR